MMNQMKVIDADYIWYAWTGMIKDVDVGNMGGQDVVSQISKAYEAAY